jgi:hypothetical protein
MELIDKLSEFNANIGRTELNIRGTDASTYNLIEIVGLPNMYKEIDIGREGTPIIDKVAYILNEILDSVSRLYWKIDCVETNRLISCSNTEIDFSLAVKGSDAIRKDECIFDIGISTSGPSQIHRKIIVNKENYSKDRQYDEVLNMLKGYLRTDRLAGSLKYALLGINRPYEFSNFVRGYEDIYLRNVALEFLMGLRKEESDPDILIHSNGRVELITSE